MTSDLARKLARYAVHLSDCATMVSLGGDWATPEGIASVVPDKCTCGLSALLAEIEGNGEMILKVRKWESTDQFADVFDITGAITDAGLQEHNLLVDAYRNLLARCDVLLGKYEGKREDE